MEVVSVSPILSGSASAGGDGGDTPAPVARGAAALALVPAAAALPAVGTRRKVRPEAFWRDAVSRQLASGRSAEAFCRDEGLHPNTFSNWKVRFQKHAQKQLSAAAPGGTVASHSKPMAPAFVRVALAAAAPPPPPSARRNGRIDILLPGRRRVRVAGIVDKGQLAEVLAVLADSMASSAATAGGTGVGC